MSKWTTLRNGLKCKDVKVGTGKEALGGLIAIVHYKITLPKGDVIVDSKAGGKPPNQIRIGARDTFVAHEYGVTGMQVGGIRLIKSPPQLTYYEQKAYSLPKNAVLTHELELLSVSKEWDNTHWGHYPGFA